MVSVASNVDTNNQHSVGSLLRDTAFVAPCLFTSLAAFILLARSHLYTENLSGQQVWLIGLSVISGVAVLRWLSGFPTTNRSTLARCGWYLQSLTILQIVLLLSVTTESSHTWGLVLVLAVVSEVLWWRQNYRRSRFREINLVVDRSLENVIENELEARLLRSLEQNSPDGDRQWKDGELPDHASQFWVRSVDLHGESISASQRIHFTTGQRYRNLHLSFVPELPSIPHIEATLLEGPDVDISVGEAHRFGVRLELKLRQRYEEPVEVLIQLEVFAEGKHAA